MKLKFFLISFALILILVALYLGATALRDKVNERYHWEEKALDNFDFSKVLPAGLNHPLIDKKLITIQNKKYLLAGVYGETTKTQSHLYLVGLDFFKRPKVLSDLDLTEVPDLMPSAPPRLEKLEDLNNDQEEELVVNLGSGGAYIEDYGLFKIKNNKLSWIELKDKDGKLKPAIFYEGSSVKNAAFWKPLEQNQGLVQFVGEANEENQWSWKAEAYFWQQEILNYDPTTSLELSQKGPVSQ